MRLFGSQSGSSLKIKLLGDFIEMESKEQKRKQELILKIEETAKEYNKNQDTSKLEIAWTNIAVFDVFMIIEIVQAIFSVMLSINENLKKKSVRPNKENIIALIKDAKQTMLHINYTLPYVWMAVKKKDFFTVPGVEFLYECIIDIDESKGEKDELKIIPKILDTFLLEIPYIIPFEEILSLINGNTINEHVHINILRDKITDSPITSTTLLEKLVKQFDEFDYDKYKNDPSYRREIGFELAIKHAMTEIKKNMNGGGAHEKQLNWLDNQEADDSDFSEETSLQALIRIINKDIIQDSDKNRLNPSFPNIQRIATAIRHAKLINDSKEKLVSQTHKIANMINTYVPDSNIDISKIQDLTTLEKDTTAKYPWIKILYPKPKSESESPLTSKEMNLAILESIIADDTSQAGGINYKNYKKTRRRIKRQYRKKTNRRKK